MEAKSKIKVMMIDDNKDFCDIVASHLKLQDDIEMLDSAHDGEEGCEKIFAQKPDVAIIDGVMPMLTGIFTANI